MAGGWAHLIHTQERLGRANERWGDSLLLLCAIALKRIRTHALIRMGWMDFVGGLCARVYAGTQVSLLDVRTSALFTEYVSHLSALVCQRRLLVLHTNGGQQCAHKIALELWCWSSRERERDRGWPLVVRTAEENMAAR